MASSLTLHSPSCSACLLPKDSYIWRWYDSKIDATIRICSDKCFETYKSPKAAEEQPKKEEKEILEVDKTKLLVSNPPKSPLPKPIAVKRKIEEITI